MEHKKIFLIIIGVVIFMGGFFVYASKNWLAKNDFSNSQNQVIEQTGNVKGKSIDSKIESQNNTTELNQNTNQQPVNQLTNQPINYIPILMYHYIRDYNDPNDQIGTNLSVSPVKFDQQLNWLKKNNYQSVDFNYLLEGSFDSARSANLSQDQNRRLAILTFDDGYLDAYSNAFPILQKYGFTATFYIISGFVGKENYMNWQQILELKNSGMNIGSHSFSHPDLSKTSDEKVEREISQSQKTLQDYIGVPITDFCYPAGKYNNRTIEILKKYGYKTATTTKNGIYKTVDDNTDKNNFYELPRLRMTNQSDLSKILK